MNDLDPEARALLRASRDGDSPNDEERARVRRKLLVAIGAAGAAGSAGQAHASAKVASGAAKISAAASGKLALAMLVVATTATGIATWSRMRAHERTPVAAPMHFADSAPATTAPAVQPATAPAQPASLAEPVQVTAAPNAVRAHVVERRSNAGVAHATRAQPHVEAAEPAAAQTSANAANAADMPSPTVAPPAASHARPVQTQDALSRELALISQAQHAVRAGQSERALALLQRHAAQFPVGALMQERFATQALALCALGRVAEGQRAIEQLARISASSPLLGSARQSCEAARVTRAR